MATQPNPEVCYSFANLPCRLKYHILLEFRVASSGMAWRGEDAENVVAMSSTDIKWVRWLRVARGFQLRVGLKDRRREGFEGFERDVSYSLLQAMVLV